MNRAGREAIAVSLRLRRAARGLGEDPVALRHLADAHGPAGQGSLMVLLAAPCMLPVPGVGTVLGMGLALWRGQTGPALPGRAGAFTLPAAWARRVLLLLAGVHGLAARLARARWAHWVDAPRQRWMGGGVGTMAVLIVLPIPMGNVLPATALMLLGLGLVFRDGLALLLAVLMGLLALAFTAALGWVAWVWGLAPLMQWTAGASGG